MSSRTSLHDILPEHEARLRGRSRDGDVEVSDKTYFQGRFFAHGDRKGARTVGRNAVGRTDLGDRRPRHGGARFRNDGTAYQRKAVLRKQLRRAEDSRQQQHGQHVKPPCINALFHGLQVK